MMKIAIVGYGNLGRACENIAASSNDIELCGIFTRRDPDTLSSPHNARFFRQQDIFDFENALDLVLICTGSANDVTELGVGLAKSFNTIDSFDTHARIPEYFSRVDAAARERGHLSFVSIGWDPGLFSMARALFNGVLPSGVTHTFWGRGVSQGHSEAIRKIDGVLDAKQYTVPKCDALRLAREGGGEWLNDRDRHLRECYVVAKQGADLKEIERKIKTMPNYFEPYDTTVHFISSEEFKLKHGEMPHAGVVLHSANVNGKLQKTEFSLELTSNPDFTASIMMAYARANAYLASLGETGARTALDIPISALFCGKDIIKSFV